MVLSSITSGLNERLDELYRIYWPGLTEALMDVKGYQEVTNPLLLHLRDEEQYILSDYKVMIFGQETNDWGQNFGARTISQLYEDYNGFFHQGDCYKYGGHFWNSFKSYSNAIQSLFPDKSVSFLWNNVIKIGRLGKPGSPEELFTKIQLELLPVLKEELRILNPDLILFFSGPRYDRFIQEQFQHVEFTPVQGYRQTELSRIHIKEYPKLAYRTYHPNYLYRRGREYNEHIKQAILSAISSVE